MRKMSGEEFDDLVRFFDGMALTKWLGSVHDQLKQASDSWGNLRVLDVGCGTGRLLLRGVEEAQEVVGIDLSEGMIAKAKEIYDEKGFAHKGKFCVGDAYELPFQDDEFDMALSTCVLFLLPDPEKGMKEMVRVVKKGGKVAMLNPAERMSQEAASEYCIKHRITDFEQKTLLQWSNISTRRHRYNQGELTQFLQRHGATKVKHTEVLEGLALITIATL